MWNFFKQQGGQIVQEYFNALLRVPPRDVAEIFTETLVALSGSFMEENLIV